MFEFNFEVNESDSSDTESPFKKPKIVEKSKSDSPKENIDWYQAEEIKPTKDILQNFDIYELNAKELTIGDIELRHLIAGFLLEDIKKHNDLDTQDLRKSEESHSDLIAGVYEGLLKKKVVLHFTCIYNDEISIARRCKNLGMYR